MEESVFVIVVAGSFLAAFFNAAFSAGGALIILAVTSTVLPVQAIVPIHSTLLIGSTTTRAWFFWRHIDWQVAGPFLVGALFGAAIGARIYIELPDALIATAISLLMLAALWLPQVSWAPKIRQPWAVVGFFHSLLSTLFAYGALLQAVILRRGLNRQQVVGTLGGCLTGMAVFKIAGYAFYGFDYSPYYRVILAAIVVSFLGTAIGKLVVDRLTEPHFRLIYRLLVTLTALRLLYVGVRNGIG